MNYRKYKSIIVVAGALIIVLVVAAITVAATSALDNKSARRAANITGGTAGNGKAAMGKYGCAACHFIPGVGGRDATVGPSLEDFARRTYIGGVIENQPDNLVRWIINPQEVDSKSAMPRLGVTEDDARDIATYLYSLD